MPPTESAGGGDTGKKSIRVTMLLKNKEEIEGLSLSGPRRPPKQTFNQQPLKVRKSTCLF